MSSLKMVVVLGLVAGFGLIQTGCPAGDENSPLVSFMASACKKGQPADVAMNAILTSVDSAGLAGLRCISWESGASGTTQLDLINFNGPCGPEWEGKATLAEGNGVTLAVTDPGCRTAKCGACIYDWSFEIEDIDSTGDVALEIQINACPGERETEIHRATLPKGETAGLLCDYAIWEAMRDQAETSGSAGTPHMSCGDEALENAETVVCDTPLVCAPNGDGEAGHDICLFPCESDTDCPLTDILSCQEGLCRIAEPWIE